MVITIMMKCIITDEMSNSVPYNKKRPVNDDLFKYVKPDKRFKGHKSNVKNDECKDQSLDDDPKKINLPIKKLVDSYSTISDRNIKLSQLILDKVVLEKVDRNITVPHISKPIEVIRNLIEAYTINKFKLTINLESEKNISIQFIISSLLVSNVYI